MSNTPAARVVIRSMGAGRGPQSGQTGILAIIYDAANIGASKYMNAGGEFHMTLRADHPQIGVIEPWQVHYAVEHWNATEYGAEYVEVFAGLITDFEADQDSVVFYGRDYLALLDLVVDTRFVAGSPDLPHTSGGSKYVDQTITDIITDQLSMARGKTDSLVNFISVGVLDAFSERATVYSTFSPVLPFVMGLVESHRQGTGKRSRFHVRRIAAQTYEFRLEDAPGVDRPALRMEYGGLVQGFSVLGFGDFAVSAHGIGRTQAGAELFYKSATAPGMPTATWGAVEKVNAWESVTDANDLTRRVQQFAAAAGRVGKRIGLALRVDALQPFVGYDITDNIPLNIVRGAVDTNAYGSGWWSIHGVEWKVFPDGHTENTLVVLPREDSIAPSPSLIPSSEVIQTPIASTRLADGAVTEPKIASGAATETKIGNNAISVSKLLVHQGRVLNNPDFETGTTAGWTFTGGGAGRIISISATEATYKGSGRYRLELTNENGVTGLEASQIVMGVQPGDVVHVSALMGGNGGTADIVVAYVNAAGADIGYSFSTTWTMGNPMARCSHKSGAAPAGTAGVRLIFRNLSSTFQTLLLDDVAYSKGDTIVTPDGTVAVAPDTGAVITSGKLLASRSGGAASVDATQDHFRIIDTFTLSVAVADSSSGSVSSTRTALGAFTTLPMYESMVTSGSGDVRSDAIYLLYAVAAPPSSVQLYVRTSLTKNASNQVVAWLEATNFRGLGSLTFSARFYIKIQVGV